VLKLNEWAFPVEMMRSKKPVLESQRAPPTISATRLKARRLVNFCDRQPGFIDEAIIF